MAKASSKTSAALRAATRCAHATQTLTFVCELPLKVTGVDEAVLLSRLEAARKIYNACLDEALRPCKSNPTV